MREIRKKRAVATAARRERKGSMQEKTEEIL